MQVIDIHTFLLHCIAITNCYAVVGQCVMIYCNTERCTDSVLTAVTFADRVFLVIVGMEIELEHIHYLPCFLG